MAVGTTEARGGADREDEGDDRDRQQHCEHYLEVMLEVFLDQVIMVGNGVS